MERINNYTKVVNKKMMSMRNEKYSGVGQRLAGLEEHDCSFKDIYDAFANLGGHYDDYLVKIFKDLIKTGVSEDDAVKECERQAVSIYRFRNNGSGKKYESLIRMKG